MVKPTAPFVRAQAFSINYDVGLTARVAEQGFKELGFPTKPYEPHDPHDPIGPKHGLVGGVSDFRELGFESSGEYPPELENRLGRHPRQVPLSEAKASLEPLFIKPVQEKAFTGFVWRRDNPPPGFLELPDTDLVWVCEVVDFVSEYRCFVVDGKILDVRRYKGDWSKAPNRSFIEATVASWQGPRGYALDFGITDKNDTFLVEFTDGYAIGDYGLHPRLYAGLLLARWDNFY